MFRKKALSPPAHKKTKLNPHYCNIYYILCVEHAGGGGGAFGLPWQLYNLTADMLIVGQLAALVILILQRWIITAAGLTHAPDELKTAGAPREQRVCCGTPLSTSPEHRLWNLNLRMIMEYKGLLLVLLLPVFSLKGVFCAVVPWTEFSEATVRWQVVLWLVWKLL